MPYGLITSKSEYLNARAYRGLTYKRELNILALHDGGEE